MEKIDQNIPKWPILKDFLGFAAFPIVENITNHFQLIEIRYLWRKLVNKKRLQYFKSVSGGKNCKNLSNLLKIYHF